MEKRIRPLKAIRNVLERASDAHQTAKAGHHLSAAQRPHGLIEVLGLWVKCTIATRSEGDISARYTQPLQRTLSGE